MTVAMPSERVIVSAPMSFAGSAKRAWRLTEMGPPWAKAPMIALAVLLIAVWWVVDLAWYCVFGLLLVPYRLIRRGSRKRKMEELRHREMMAAVANAQRPPTT